MIYLKTHEEIEKMYLANQVVAKVLQEMESFIKPGVTTGALDDLAEEIIRSYGAEPSFLGYGTPPFPASICTSVNEAVVHGIPSHKYVIQEGDLVSIDCGAVLDGWQGDAARTYMVGEVSEEAKKLVKVTEECFWLGLEQAVIGNRLGDLSSAIQRHAEANGFSVIRELTGHGIGKSMHEEPSVPNYGTAGRGIRFEEGMVLAVEPMIAAGKRQISILDDDWTIVMADGKPAAHYENSFAITKDGPRVLSLYEK